MGADGPVDPTDPAAQQETIAHLRELISQHGKHPGARTGPAPDRSDPDQSASEGAAPDRFTPDRLDQERAPGGRPAPAPTAPRTHVQWVEAGREIALRQLTFSARSSHQLREAMVAREVPPEAADEVISRLERVGLIDDAEYAAMLVRTRHAERGLARRALEVELAKKGIAPDIAQDALEQVDSADESAAAVAIVRKRVASMRGLDGTKRRNRLYGTLARKGYSAGVARAAIDEVLTEEGLDLY